MIKIEKIWITDNAVFIRSTEGLEASENFCDFPRLANASREDLLNFETDDYGIYWPSLDEDLSFAGFFKHKPSNPLFNLFSEYPELNASAVARRLGISQSLLAQYISGAKRPSEERLSAILGEVRNIGRKLACI